MCSNISTETTRSKRTSAGISSAFTSQVTTSRLRRLRAVACASMCRFCEREFDTAVIRALG
jgi:hypothetical protein